MRARLSTRSGWLRRECERRRAASRIADKMEALEARIIRETFDAGRLGRERVGGRGDVGSVDLEVLVTRIDVAPQFGDECAVSGFRRHDAAGKEDHLKMQVWYAVLL